MTTRDELAALAAEAAFDEAIDFGTALTMGIGSPEAPTHLPQSLKIIEQLRRSVILD